MKKKMCPALGLLLALCLLLPACSAEMPAYDRSARTPVDEGEQTYRLDEKDYETYFNFIVLFYNRFAS